ncbi:hypothetical protein ACKWTF_008116 [Chironomus riparius]
MEEADKVVLHYQMLEYLFNKCKLATSCFNHAWESFLIEYPEYKNSLTASELKNIFWTEIATNIDQYELLTEEQEEYFNYDGCILNISDENLLETFEKTEPRRESDYLFLKTEENYRQLVPQRTQVTEQNVQNVFNEPNNCTKNNDITLNIIGTKEHSEMEVKSEFKLSCLMLNLFTNTDELSNNEEDLNIEILNKLRNPNVCTDDDHLGFMSDDWSKSIYGDLDENTSNLSEDLSIMLNIPKPNIDSSQSIESLSSSIQSQSSLSILMPQISRTPTRSMTRSLSQTTPTSQTRRNILQSSSKSSTPSRNTRSRRALVPDPALNLKMSKFMEKHGRRNK